MTTTSTHGGARPGAGRPRKTPGASTAWISATTHAAIRAALRPGESRSAFIAAAIAREVAARTTQAPARRGEE